MFPLETRVRANLKSNFSSAYLRKRTSRHVLQIMTVACDAGPVFMGYVLLCRHQVQHYGQLWFSVNWGAKMYNTDDIVDASASTQRW